MYLKLAINEMYPRIFWELVADSKGSADHSLGTTILYNSSKR